MEILIINGPNLNLLGKRQPKIYGTQTFEAYFEDLKKSYEQHDLFYFQSNHEGALIDQLHEFGFSIDGIILNAGGYTHTSIALADAVTSIDSPVIEVHISNIYKREKFRQHSFLESVCIESIVGKGIEGYAMAIDFLEKRGNL